MLNILQTKQNFSGLFYLATGQLTYTDNTLSKDAHSVVSREQCGPAQQLSLCVALKTGVNEHHMQAQKQPLHFDLNMAKGPCTISMIKPTYSYPTLIIQEFGIKEQSGLFKGPLP